MISVIIPCYNHGATLGRTIESLLAQTFGDREIIVVDDGSTDASADVIKRYQGRITAVHQENSGGPSARNRGFAVSKGDEVIFCDADIVMRPDALEKLHAALETHPEAAYAYPSFRLGWKKFACGPFEAERLRKINFVHTSALIRRTAFPGFDETLKRFQDWDLWLTMLERGKTGVWVPETLFTVLAGHGRISAWAPSFFYRIPWGVFGFRPKLVAKYEDAAAIVRQKHRL